MEIYFIKIDEFVKNVEQSSLEFFLDEKIFASDKRRLEYCLGRFLLKYVLKTRYFIDNPKILIKNNKPFVDWNNIFFSLSHSKNYVMAVFDKNNTGIDIEFMKPRDFEKLFAHYNLFPEKKDKKTFYQLWTKYEAQIKLQENAVSNFSAIFSKDYCLSVCSPVGFDISKTLKIYELKSPTQRMNPSELINLKLVIESKKNENTLVAHEISTAEPEFELLEPLNLKIE